MVAVEILVVLALVALVAGIGITAIGPGGIVVTISLFLLVPLSSAEVAGTASATFVATGALGTAVYYRSGDFHGPGTRELAVGLSTASVVGALVGTWVNLSTTDRLFALLLGLFVAGIGGLILYRELVGLRPTDRFRRLPAGPRRAVIGSIGLGIGLFGAMLGVGGPVMAVPILVVLGVPMLAALAVAQVQSIVISGFATLGYAAAGAVSLPFVLLVGIPQLVGVVIGWRIAHRLDPGRLRLGLGIVLLLIAPVLVL